MSVTLTCPRCGVEVRAPGIWSDSWTCPVHGGIAPLHPAVVGGPDAFHHLGPRCRVPLWLPWPLPTGWLVSGLRTAGDEHTGPIAAVVACSGPNPMATGHSGDGDAEPRSADLLLVAEQPGVGLGAHLVGLPDVDPGTTVADGAPHLRLVAAGHETPLWAVPGNDVTAYVGEAAGVWLWVLVWPERAGVVLLEQFALLDARDAEYLRDVPHGALSPRLG